MSKRKRQPAKANLAWSEVIELTKAPGPVFVELDAGGETWFVQVVKADLRALAATFGAHEHSALTLVHEDDGAFLTRVLKR